MSGDRAKQKANDLGWGRMHRAPCYYCGAKASAPVYAERTVCNDTAGCRERLFNKLRGIGGGNA